MKEHCHNHCAAVTDSIDRRLAGGLPDLSVCHRGSNAQLLLYETATVCKTQGKGECEEGDGGTGLTLAAHT